MKRTGPAGMDLAKFITETLKSGAPLSKGTTGYTILLVSVDAAHAMIKAGES